MKLLRPTLIAAFMFGLIPNTFAVDFSEAYGVSSMEEKLRIYKNINNQINDELENNTIHYEKDYKKESEVVFTDEKVIDYVIISESEEPYNGYILARSNIKSEEIISAKSLTKEETSAKVEAYTEPSVENEEEVGTLKHLWNRFKYNTSETWSNPSTHSLIIPFYAWHNRLTYDREKYEEYNELAWGIGFSRVRYDEDDNWHSLYAMIFEDSNYHPQTMFGYAYQRRWYFDCDHNWFAGAGFTVGLTQREEYSFIPVPLPLPLVSAGHRRFNINMGYVPGVRNDGNVAFFFANYEF